MTSKDDVIGYISEIDSVDEIHSLNELLNRRKRQLDQQGVHSFHIGQKVSFTGRGGVKVEGVVEKINIKTVGVNVDGQSWRAAPNILTVVD